MTTVYRILRRAFARTPLDGDGAYRFGGRWSSIGVRVAYTAGNLSLAMIEYFVQLDPDDPPRDLVVVAADIPEGLARTSLSQKRLPSNWRQNPAPPELTRFGDSFIPARRFAILTVPSVLAPTEANWLINPVHPDFVRIRLHQPQSFHYDSRFFR